MKRIVPLPKWKKIVLLVIGLLCLMRIGYITVRGEVDKSYHTFEYYDFSDANPVPCTNIEQTFLATQKRLNSIELYFTDIADDKLGAVQVCINYEDSLIYQTNVTLAGMNNSEWKQIFVNAELREGEKYKITLNVNSECTQVPNVLVVNNAYAPEIIESFLNGERISGNVAINYGYLQFPGRLDRIVMVSLWVLFYIVIFYTIANVEKIINKYSHYKKLLLNHVDEKLTMYVMEILLCIVIVSCSGIEFQELTKILLYVISLTSAVGIKEKNIYVDRIADKTWKKVILSVLYFYAAFALVGQRIWIYPLALKLTTEGLFVYLATVLWFIPVVKSIIFYLNVIAETGFGSKKVTGNILFVVLCSGILVIPAAYNLFANNPGISSNDTYNCMITSAHNLHGTNDWHPAFYCMVLRTIQKIWDSTYAVILVQYFFWIYVMCEFFLYLRKKDISDSAILGTALFCGLNAGNFLHLNTIWKDIPYTLSLLWAFVLIAKLAIDFDEYKSKWYIYIELIVSLVGVYFYRKNGLVSFIVITTVLIVFLYRNKRIVVSLLISIILIFVIQGPIYSYFEVRDLGYGGIYHGLGQDILGAYYSGGEVSEKTLQMINMMTAYNNAEYSYTPTWSNQSYNVKVPPTEFVLNYIDTFIKNPVIMMRAVIDREDALWDIYLGRDSFLGCVNYTATLDSVNEWNDYYPKRIYRSLYTTMSAATAYTANAQWISAIEWRCGTHVLLAIIAIVLLIIRFGFDKRLVILAPPVGHIMSLLLTTGWSDFRYFWVMNLISLCTIFLTIVIIRERD